MIINFIQRRERNLFHKETTYKTSFAILWRHTLGSNRMRTASVVIQLKTVQYVGPFAALGYSERTVNFLELSKL